MGRNSHDIGKLKMIAQRFKSSGGYRINNGRVAFTLCITGRVSSFLAGIDRQNLPQAAFMLSCGYGEDVLNRGIITASNVEKAQKARG